MKKNNRKEFNLYTRGQRFAARGLLIVGMCVSCSLEGALAKRQGFVALAQTAFVGILLSTPVVPLDVIGHKQEEQSLPSLPLDTCPYYDISDQTSQAPLLRSLKLKIENLLKHALVDAEIEGLNLSQSVIADDEQCNLDLGCELFQSYMKSGLMLTLISCKLPKWWDKQDIVDWVINYLVDHAIPLHYFDIMFGGDKVTYLNSNIGKIESLQKLTVTRCNLKALPPSLGNLPNLRTLRLTGTSITWCDLPKALKENKSLDIVGIDEIVCLDEE